MFISLLYIELGVHYAEEKIWKRIDFSVQSNAGSLSAIWWADVVFLLCVCVCVFIGDDESQRKGQVLTLLAEQALHNHDCKASYIHCQDLMAAGRFKLNYLQLIVLSHCFMGERKKACLVVSQSF